MANKNEITLKLAEESDKKRLIELYNRHLGPPRNEEQWDWEFTHTPHGNPIHSTIWLDYELIGQVIIIPIRMYHKAHQMLSGRAQALLIDKKYQLLAARKGIVKKLFDFVFSQCKQNGMDLIWGMPNAKAVRSFSSLGFMISDIVAVRSDLTFAQSVLPISRKIDRTDSGILKMMLKKIAKIPKYYRFMGIRGGQKIELIETSDRYSDYADFFMKQKANYGLTIDRDESFMNWRFSNNPFHRNTALFFKFNGEIIAAMIISFQKQQWITKCYLVDFIVDGNISKPVAALLIKKLREYCRAKSADQLVVWKNYKNCTFRNIFDDAIHFSMPKKAGNFMHKSLLNDNDRLSIVADNKDWFLTMAFMEGTSF